MSNFVQRTLSGAVYVGLVVASILVHPVFFAVLFGLVTVLAVCEYHHLMRSDCFLTIVSAIAAGVMFFGAAFCFLITTYYNDLIISILIGLYLFLVLFALISELFRKAQNPIANWGHFLVSQVMIALPFSMMCFVMYADSRLLLALFILIWLNDSGAYCVGSLMAKRKGGNHKMFLRVSPGKSWEGLIGGAVVAIAVGALLAYAGCFDRLNPLNVYAIGCVFALVVVVFGTLGDLMESLMKRTIGVKDSGKFLPGHGGVLDRFDSILLATPAVCLLLYVLISLCGA